MKKFMNIAKFSSVLAISLLPSFAFAAHMIAHRGVFHDINSNQTIPENSFYSVLRAHHLGMSGVELDLRLTSDHDIIVTHDMISNRTTNADNAGGKMNPVDIFLHHQGAPSAIHIAQHPSKFWKGSTLKSYGRNATLIPGKINGHIQDLYSLFSNLSKDRSHALHDRNFMIVLDIQDPLMLKLAANVVKFFKAENTVYLKFFASKALYNTAAYRYNGADTCYNYEKRNNLTGLNIIPQINDGELDINENDEAGIKAFQTKLSIPTYLQCWADAQAQHRDAAKMSIVSASVPAYNYNAQKGASQALMWAQRHGRKRMTIVPNPDAGRKIENTCQLFSFQSNNVSAARFNYNARSAKVRFTNIVKADYVVIDVMGDALRKRYSTTLKSFQDYLCN